MEPSVGETASGTSNPMDRVAELCRATSSHEPVAWLCRALGGFFVRNPFLDGAEGADVLRETNEILRHFSHLLSVVAEANRDSRLTTEESVTIRTAWEKLKCAAERFVVSCEAVASVTERGGDSLQSDR
jgi:hypothetical protein